MGTIQGRPKLYIWKCHGEYDTVFKLPLTNATSDSARLSLTVSKPPFGVAGILGANNQVSLAEGTTLAPGESATAILYCSVPKEQWNTDPYQDNAQWTMNVDDPKLWKATHPIRLSCRFRASCSSPVQRTWSLQIYWLFQGKQSWPPIENSDLWQSKQHDCYVYCCLCCWWIRFLRYSVQQGMLGRTKRPYPASFRKRLQLPLCR